ncbi:MAG: 50S ribosomal protein L11 methyltransferase [Proteobacteria bacterium]|nr:50S ribosomal protein L11 methyltransferase [Pseudomonadota bacterium]
MSWYKITITPNDSQLSTDELDSICATLIEAGAVGTSIELAPEICCFVEGNANSMLHIIAAAEELGCDVLSREEVLEKNWSAACPELWLPLEAGKLKIVPVESAEDPRQVDSDALKIIPGLGFGTGHHATTRMILTLLSSISTSQTFSSVFDLGTGSGILAIAAAKLFNAQVIAIDNDPLAINNALDNISLNRVQELVHASTDPIQTITQSFPLILANLYGEALVTLSAEVTRLAAPGCVLILSGITELMWEHVIDTYSSKHGWILEQELSDSGWICLVLRCNS